MASHVIVIDSTARRVTVKTTPNKPLSDVLEEACAKFGISASQYGLKNNKKQVDLSRTIRLSGLSSGAKLELVQLSKSAGVVSVALQLPDSIAQGVPNGRLTDKFPSTTTLWLILRKFEAGVAGGGSEAKKNFTARGTAGMNAGPSGAGRLYYETPVVQIMGRELFSFTDLQKTLGQLGFNSGSTLLRLAFRATETPLEEAMIQIEEYFKSVGSPVPEKSAPSTSAAPETQQPRSEPVINALEQSPEDAGSSADAGPDATPEEGDPIARTASGRPLSIFRPPTSSTPSAALLSSHNPSDYTPTVEHAQTHQRMLSQSSRNVRLPTEAEIAAQAEAEREKLAAIKDVEIKIRFPDESAVTSFFKQEDSAGDLYVFVRECLDERWTAEKFLLRSPGMRGPTKSLSASKGEIVPDDSSKKLIRNLGLRGRVMLIFSWDEEADVTARATKSVLKKHLQQQARELKVEDISKINADDDAANQRDEGVRVNVGKGEGDEKGKKPGGVPKWLKGLSKK